MGPRADGRPPARDAALARLPGIYARASRLRDSGAGRPLIAERLRVEPQALDALSAIAEAKLAALPGEDG
ncbi:hypothetical protein [Amycolatopsis thermophila]|uniref:Uncharacterized protein n=1 Tax=Amycolatopsis thermophila TaxID=206084 RepID=A0ABU0F2T2_9PSEU|nr:hypothetical protein [Amycolatopsis thermophila]MDQ0381885.1 hypothetical protein [Amycolatopsis thermophila]